MSFTSSESSSNGTSRLKSYLLANALNSSELMLPLVLTELNPGAEIAPLDMLRAVLGTISSGENFLIIPKPEHSGHAPLGLLNENDLGSISGMLIPQSGHAKFSLNVMLLSPITSTVITPPDSAEAVSAESASLFCIPSFIFSLSTTISITCFLFFSSFISSDRSYISPSILTLTYQFFLA